MKFYFIPQYGLGNIIQTTPAVRWLQQQGEVTILTHPKHQAFNEVVYRDHQIVTVKKDNRSTIKSCNPSMFKKGGQISEVEMNLHLAGCKNPAPEDKTGFCGFEESQARFDIVFCDGYNKRKNKTDWLVKSYAYWPELAAHFKHLNIASIGTQDEYIPGTENRTGIGLLNTLGLIRNAKLVVCNDTGFFHAACVFGVRALALFTMTDVTKNFDPIFHKTGAIISRELECQPCQLNEHNFWIKNKPHCHWACRFIPTQKVIEKIEEMLSWAN